MDVPVLILGCGFTGIAVARRLAQRGIRVLATSRNPERLAQRVGAGIAVARLEVAEAATLAEVTARVEPGVRVLHSIPVIESGGARYDPTPELLDALGRRPARVIYLSTTGVYGATFAVNEHTAAAPCSEHGRLRLEAERAVEAGPCSSLIQRPAAIYGPGRGVHESLRRGRFRLAGDGSNIVSRIHVDDLAAVADAALFSDLIGTYPVADEAPCSSAEMARFCAGLLSLPLPEPVDRAAVHHTRRANRRVDGRAIFRLLGVRLRHPSYRTGVPAALAADKEG